MYPQAGRVQEPAELDSVPHLEGSDTSPYLWSDFSQRSGIMKRDEVLPEATH